ncbi:hypothetical protein [Streptomyces phaeochromogenes]|uniref:hypothetical protein n=1 Tax=Streptomyces phaeochromogenes TaxID=1923 RepID=UPI0036AC1BC6
MNESGGYDELLALLAGPADFWDRPTGDWVARNSGAEDIPQDVSEARQDANAAYLLGTNALRRNDLDSAEVWFAVACDQQHPGAAFRAALTQLLAAVPPKIVLSGQVGSGKSRAVAARMLAQIQSGETLTFRRPVGSGKSRVIGLLAAAATWGHGDAQRLIDRLRSDSGECAVSLPRPAGELAAVADDDDLAGMVLVADLMPYEPQDAEFYPTTRVLLEQCFAPYRPAPHAPFYSEWPVGTVHQEVTSTHRLLDADSGQELCTSEGLFAALWSSRWRSLAGSGLDHGSRPWRPGSPGRRLALSLADNDEAQLVLPQFPVVLWSRSCSQEASTPWVHHVSEEQCPRCTSELTPFTAALVEALRTDQQSPLISFDRLFESMRRILRTQETLQCPEGIELGSHPALLWDDPGALSPEPAVALRAQHPRSSPGPITGFAHRTFQEYLHNNMDSPPSAGFEGFVDRRARWHKLHEGERKTAVDRSFSLAAAMFDGVDSRSAEQLAASVLVSVRGLSAGFDLPRPSHLHVVCDKTQQLYFFANPHDGSGDPEELRLAVPTVVTSPPGDSEEAAQPIAAMPSPSEGRSELRELNRTEPLQVYALDT